MTNTPHEFLDLVTEGTTFFLDRLGSPPDEQLRQDSLLPGWTRAHVVAHVARNADALGNLLHWAKTGEETPMYSGPEQRNGDIESSAAQSAEELLVDVRRTAEILAVELAGLSEQDWGASVRTAQGRTISATKIPWLRVREVWLHAVDLDNDSATIESLPSSLVDSLLDEMVRAHGSKPGTPSFALAPTDRDRRWETAGEDVATTVIEAPAARLLAWLSGRDKTGRQLRVSGTQSLPDLDAWL